MTILPSQQSVAARPRSGSIAARLTVRRRRWLERADPDDRFDSSPFVHGRVGVGDVVQVGLVVEQTAGVNGAVKHVGEQLGDVDAGWGDAAALDRTAR